MGFERRVGVGQSNPLAALFPKVVSILGSLEASKEAPALKRFEE